MANYTQYEYDSSSKMEKSSRVANPYMVITPKGYTKHYYANDERLASVPGGGGWCNMSQDAISSPATQHESYLMANWEKTYKEVTNPFDYPQEPASPLTNNVDINNIDYPDLQYGCSLRKLQSLTLEYNQDILLQSMMDNCEIHGAEQDIYYTHSDHLGSANWITDKNGAPVQYLHYLPYGQLLANQQATGSTYDERYKFTGKERDEESGYDYFGARYYSSVLTHWLSVDPLADKYPNISPYAYCHWSPINRIDPDGRADYYDVDGNHLCNDGVADNRVFQQSSKGDVVLGGYATPFSYVGDVDNISLSYDGEMISDSQSEGILTVTQHVGDKEFNQTFSAVSGNRTAYTLQNGEYSCSSFRYRSSSEAHGGYYNNGYGFSINLNPSFKTMRTDLRIHPDGGAQGTLGCIGLTGGASELKQFVRTVTPFVPADPKNTSILLTVVVTGNPGCFKPADKTGPALFR